MDNFDDFENKEYVKAKLVKYSAADQLGFLWNFLIIVLQVTFFFFWEVLISAKELVFPNKPKNIAGQLALVTGGGNGLGRALAFRLAQENCHIVIIDLNLNEAQKTASEIAEKFNVKTAAYKVDVSDYNAIQQLKVDIEKTLGFVDILVNNAGILSIISLREGQPKDIQKLVDVNLTSHFWTVRTFLDGMIQRRRGHIIGISSLGGKISFPLSIGYCATKHGVRGFMGALYDELCLLEVDQFVNTTTVYPSFINTRKELSDVLDQTKEMGPRMSPQYVADNVVKGMLLNKLDITLPYGIGFLQVLNFLPQRVMKFAKSICVPQIPNVPATKNGKM